MLRWVSALIRLRTRVPALRTAATAAQHRVWLFDKEHILVLHRWHPGGSAALLIVGFNDEPTKIRLVEPAGQWRLELESEAQDYAGEGRAPMPKELNVTPKAVPLVIGQYGVALFIS